MAGLRTRKLVYKSMRRKTYRRATMNHANIAVNSVGINFFRLRNREGEQFDLVRNSFNDKSLFAHIAVWEGIKHGETKSTKRFLAIWH